MLLEAELERVRVEYNTIRLHAGIGYVTPTTNTKDEEARSARPDARDYARHAPHASPTVAATHKAGPDRGGEFLRPDASLTQKHLTTVVRGGKNWNWPGSMRRALSAEACLWATARRGLTAARLSLLLGGGYRYLNALDFEHAVADLAVDLLIVRACPATKAQDISRACDYFAVASPSRVVSRQRLARKDQVGNYRSPASWRERRWPEPNDVVSQSYWRPSSLSGGLRSGVERFRLRDSLEVAPLRCAGLWRFGRCL